MARCTIRKGFFLLKDCDNPARYSCNTCGRPVCEEHSREFQGHRVCTDCLADTNNPYRTGERVKDEVVRLRREYGTGSGRYYSPFYSGRYRDRFYNDYDILDANEFEQTAYGDQDLDGSDDDFDFMDS